MYYRILHYTKIYIIAGLLKHYIHASMCMLQVINHTINERYGVVFSFS